MTAEHAWITCTRGEALDAWYRGERVAFWSSFANEWRELVRTPDATFPHLMNRWRRQIRVSEHEHLEGDPLYWGEARAIAANVERTLEDLRRVARELGGPEAKVTEEYHRGGRVRVRVTAPGRERVDMSARGRLHALEGALERVRAAWGSTSRARHPNTKPGPRDVVEQWREDARHELEHTKPPIE